MTATFIWKQVFTNYPQLHYPLLPQQITKYYCNLTGNYLQVRLNNQANEDALIIHELMISRYPDCQIAQTLTFQNQPHFQVAGGQSLWTDAAEFPVTAGETYYLSLKATNISGTINSLGYAPAHLIYQQLTAPPNSSLKDYYYGIDALRCQSTDPAVLVSFFGDSIIGQGYLSENISRLFYHHWPQKITTCNAGIFGNRLLHSGQIMSQNPTSFSQAGNQRFNPDVLYDQPQIVITLTGSNDLMTAGAGCPNRDLPNSQQLISGIQRLAKICQWRKTIFVPLTLPPFQGATNLGLATWQPLKEHVRKLTNHWIMQLPNAIDLANYVTAKSNSAALAPEFDSGDHWHFSASGARQISQFIYHELRNAEVL